MRKAFLIIPAVLTVTLLPGISKADAPTCFGQPATLVAVAHTGDDPFGDTIIGTDGPDVIVGSDLDDNLRGGGGDDLICGRGDSDDLIGGPGDDRVSGGYGGDIFGSFHDASVDEGNDRLLGGPDEDQFYGTTGDDFMDSGGGTDWLWFLQPNGPGPVTVNLATGRATGWGNQTLKNVENVAGTRLYADVLIGDDGPNVLSAGWGRGSEIVVGNGGNDILKDGLGHDTLRGGAGDDVIRVQEGNDSLRGGFGTDTVWFDADISAVTANLRTGIATGQGTDSLSGIENIVGTRSDDTLLGDSGPNVLEGGAYWGTAHGQDVFRGRGGDDWLKGADPNEDSTDSLGGGIGNDICDADPRDIVVRCEG